jgi:hypothetical protein
VRACEGLGPRPGQFESDNNGNAKDDGIELITHPGGYYLAASLKDKSTADIGSELAFDLAIDCEDLWSYAARLGSMHSPGCTKCQPAGLMFWLMWKRLPGSYLALTLARRA